MNTHPLDWADLVPIVAVLTVMQVALVSVSKLIALSEIFKIGRFGQYSEAAATLGYCSSVFISVSLWWHGDRTRSMTISERRPATTEWVQVSAVFYLVVLGFLTMFLLPRSWFRWNVWAVYCGVLGLEVVLATCVLLIRNSGVTVAANVVAVVGGLYLLAWPARYVGHAIAESEKVSSWISPVVAWLDRPPA